MLRFLIILCLREASQGRSPPRPEFPKEVGPLPPQENSPASLPVLITPSRIAKCLIQLEPFLSRASNHDLNQPMLNFFFKKILTRGHA